MRLLRPFSIRSITGGRLLGLIARPHTTGPHPVVFVIPGALGSGFRMAASAGAAALVRDGVAVVGFNAAGRGRGRPWDPRSAGTPGLNGPTDQDDLAAVIRWVVSRRWSDADTLGIASVSYGLVAAAGCLARHPDLPVGYLIDEEGPSDRYAAMLRAWCLAAVDGPDWPQRAAELFGVTTADEAFWQVREPIRTIGRFRGRYLRLQATFDHVQPPRSAGHIPLFHRPPEWWHNKHALDLLNAAVDGGVPWCRINLPAQGNPLGERATRDTPPRWLSGSMEEHPGAWIEAVRELAGRGTSP